MFDQGSHVPKSHRRQPPPPPAAAARPTLALTRARLSIALHAHVVQGKGQFYDLETLLFFARHINSKFSEYFKKANKEIGKAVTFVDRRVRWAAWLLLPGGGPLACLWCTGLPATFVQRAAASPS